MKGWSKGTTYISVAMMAGGFLLIVLAWNGAASVDFVQGQIPYLISGGLAGASLIIAGLVLAVIQDMRRSTLTLTEKLEELTEIVAKGQTGSGPTAVPTDGSMVVAGRTTYHNNGCHLIEGRSDLQVMSASDASGRGLAPCRICDPQIKVS